MGRAAAPTCCRGALPRAAAESSGSHAHDIVRTGNARTHAPLMQGESGLTCIQASLGDASPAPWQPASRIGPIPDPAQTPKLT
jgi:hypothetical protein